MSGVGTGAKFAPTYACLGAGKFESLMFNTNNELIEKILIWKRFIDDVLCYSMEMKKIVKNWLNG